MKKFTPPVFSLRKLTWSIIILLFVGFIGYVGLNYWARLNLQGLYFFNWGREASTEPVLFTVGPTTLKVPKNYLYQRDLMRGGNVAGFSMEVLLPDFTPYNDSLKYEFDECRGNCRRINISVHKKAAVSGNWLDFHFARILEQVKISKNGSGSRDGDGSEFGLTHFSEFGSKIERVDGYAQFNPNGNVVFFYRCSKESSVPSPGCTGYMEYAGLTVEYHHHRRYLANWQDIQHKVLQLLESFEQLNSKGEK